jgi:hypothetical protein
MAGGVRAVVKVRDKTNAAETTVKERRRRALRIRVISYSRKN